MLRRMAIIRAQVSFGADLPDPRHRLQITPHFNAQDYDPIGGTNWQTLCDDLAAAMSTYTGGSREVQVKLYNAEQAPPAFPKATKTLNPGLYPASSGPRELAICLSYKGGDGPRRRGRLYVPFPLQNSSSVGVRPPQTHRQKVADLAPLLRALGGANVQWGVWSRMDQEFYPADSAYVDDEWDVIRSRGLAPTNRLAAGTGS